MKIFNSVSDLQAASLTAGQLTQTKRYYAGQDGGGATYLIKTAVDYAGTPDEYGDHSLANGNVAVLQTEGSVNVKLFGATGDGVADDTAALQAAIDYCTNLSNRKQTLYFPANNAGAVYKVTDTLTVSGRLTIKGDGPFSTNIYGVGFTTNKPIVHFTNDPADVVYYGGIEELTIRSDNNLARGIEIKDLSYALFKNIQLYGLYNGVYVTGTNCFSNFFEQVTAYQITTYSVHFDSFTGGGQYKFDSCTFTGNVGFFLSNTAATDGLNFIACNFEQCASNDVYIAGNVSNMVITGCRSEGLDGSSSILLAPDASKYIYGVSITGNTWATDNGNAYAVALSGSGTVKGFTISGNSGLNVGYLGFVQLNGVGEAGSIFGNYAENASATSGDGIVNSFRNGVACFNNWSNAGRLAEYELGSLSGTLSPTVAGFTSAPTPSLRYALNGDAVTLDIPYTAGTSNSGSFTFSTLPANLRPSVDTEWIVRVTDNGSPATGFLRVSSSGVISVYASTIGAAFTASGAKALSPVSVSYTTV